MRPILVLLAIVAGLWVPVAAAFEMRAESELAVRTEIPFTASPAQRAMHDTWLGFRYGSLWMVANPDLLRIDPRTGATRARIGLPRLTGPIRPIAFGGGAVWIADSGSGDVYKVDAETNALVLTRHLRLVQRDSLLGFGDGSLWIATADSASERTLTRLDAETGEIEAEIAMPEQIDSGVLFAGGAAWAISNRSGQVFRVDPVGNAVVATIPVHDMAGLAVAAGDAIFVHTRSGWLERIDPADDSGSSTFEPRTLGFEELAYDGLWVWLATPLGLFQVDPGSGGIVGGYANANGLSFFPNVTYGDGALWMVRRNFRTIVGLAPPGD